MNTLYLDFTSLERLSQRIKDTHKSLEPIFDKIKDASKFLKKFHQNNQQITKYSTDLSSSIEAFTSNSIAKKSILKNSPISQHLRESLNLSDSKNSLDSIKLLERPASSISTSLSQSLQEPKNNLSKSISKNQLDRANYKLGREQKIFLVKLLELSGSTTDFVEWNSTQWFSKDRSVLINGKRSNFSKRLVALTRRNLIIHKKEEKRKEYIKLTQLGFVVAQQLATNQKD
jgi:hypothetical protein